MTEAELIEETKTYMMLSFDDEVRPFAFADSPEGLLIIAMPDSDVPTQRMLLRSKLPKEKATLAVVCNEAWHTRCTTPEDAELCERLHAAGKLFEAPAHLLGEEVQLWVEGLDRPITLLAAEITKVEGKRVLGEWKERQLNLPRPTFRRYFPEAGR